MKSMAMNVDVWSQRIQEIQRYLFLGQRACFDILQSVSTYQKSR